MIPVPPEVITKLKAASRRIGELIDKVRQEYPGLEALMGLSLPTGIEDSRAGAYLFGDDIGAQMDMAGVLITATSLRARAHGLSQDEHEEHMKRCAHVGEKYAKEMIINDAKLAFQKILAPLEDGEKPNKSMLDDLSDPEQN